LGSQYVLSGGSAVSATIEGLQVVSAGGFVSATKLMSGFTGYPAVLKDAGTVSGVTISGAGASAVVLSGGVESGAVVSSGGTDIVSSGGSTTGTVVNSGGTEMLYIGAAFTNATFSAGANVALTGLISGPLPVQVNGLTSTLTGQTLASGATTSDLTEVLSATVASGGEVDVNSGGLIGATTISTGGSAFVSSGGRTSGVTLVAGGSETILSSGSAKFHDDWQRRHLAGFLRRLGHKQHHRRQRRRVRVERRLGLDDHSEQRRKPVRVLGRLRQRHDGDGRRF
jgi:fibronectin-binding autotransporter adhesin